MTTKYKIIFAISFLLTIFLGIPSASVFAALEQPAGQYPITEPLKPMDPGVKPNYSGNIQDGEPANLDQSEDGYTAPTNNPETSVDETVGDNELGKPVPSVEAEEKGKGKILLAGIILVVVVAGVIWFLRKNKSGGAGAAVFLAALTLSGFLVMSTTATVFAQTQGNPQSSPLNSNQPIQRTIIPEDQIEEEPFTSPESGNKSFYVIITVALLLVAGGGWYFFARRTEPPKF